MQPARRTPCHFTSQLSHPLTLSRAQELQAADLHELDAKREALEQHLTALVLCSQPGHSAEVTS